MTSNSKESGEKIRPYASLKKTSKDCIDVEIPLVRSKEWEFYIFVPGDVHFDNPCCDRDLYKEHMDEVKRRNALIFYGGDLFCLMEGRYDPRRSRSGIRPEYNSENYFDLVIDDMSNFHSNYFRHIIGFFKGNHETAVLKNQNTSVLDKLSEAIYWRTGQRIPVMGYQGYIRLKFNHSTTGRHFYGMKIAVHHGKWGGVVTRGVLSVARYGLIFPDADIITTFHTHDQWALPTIGYRLSNAGNMLQKRQLHIKSPTYKQEFAKNEGFAPEKIVQPKPLGGYWLKFTWDTKRESIYCTYEEAIVHSQPIIMRENW